jgi:hypothetical protein
MILQYLRPSGRDGRFTDTSFYRHGHDQGHRRDRPPSPVQTCETVSVIRNGHSPMCKTGVLSSRGCGREQHGAMLGLPATADRAREAQSKLLADYNPAAERTTPLTMREFDAFSKFDGKHSPRAC